MIEERIGHRYAKSVYDLANEKGVTKTVYEDMEVMFDTCKGSKDLRNFLSSPIIASDKKHKVLDAVFNGKFSSELLPLLMNIIIRKGREMYLFEIAQAFIEIYDKKNAIERGEIVSAEAMDAQTIAEIKRLIEAKTGKSFKFEERVDESLIGGFVLRVGDKLFDGSVSASLRRLKHEFDDNAFVKAF